MQESWKDIPWFEWLYQASNLWRIKSFKQRKERILKFWNYIWYSVLQLYKNKVVYKSRAHRYIAITFIDNPNNYPCVCHKDETLDKNWFLYNWVDNLYWGTNKQNTQDMIKKWRHFSPYKWSLWIKNSKSKALMQYTKDFQFIRNWDCVSDAWRELWIWFSSIAKCCRERKWTAGGFIWRYKNY